MKIITQLFILPLSLLLVNGDRYCDYLLKQYNTFKTKCSPDLITINSCCDLTGFTLSKAPSAVYQMMTNCNCGSPFTKTTADVYCDMNTTDGGWIVIQRNRKGSTLDFNKNWIQYEAGFGDLNGDFWYGLEAIHCLTQTGQWEMRVDYQKNDKTWSYLHYYQFSVGSASQEYPLTVRGFTGEGVDEFSRHPLDGMKFSTADNDNDRYNNANCAAQGYGPWWHNSCALIHINKQPPIVSGQALFTEMKIRQKDCITK